jgi:hypothetical protein
MRIKIFTLPYALTDIYSPELVSIAYGMIQLGHEVFGNVNFWKKSDGQWLVNESDSNAYDLGLFDWRFAYHCRTWIWDSRFTSVPSVIVDRSAGMALQHRWLRDGWLDRATLILRSDAIAHEPQFANVRPWAIGIIPEVMNSIDQTRKGLTGKEDVIWQSFRVNHSVRRDLIQHLELVTSGSDFSLVRDIVVDKDQTAYEKALNEVTGGRFNVAFHEKLNAAPFTLAVGGYWEMLPFGYYKAEGPFKSKSPYGLGLRVKKKIRRYFVNVEVHPTNRHRCIVQWDSFRLWESLYADTVPILFDFDYWGFQLPVKPVEGVHYIGIKSFDCSGLVDVISRLDDAGRERIAQAGREFVLTNYGPRAVAQRVLDYVANRP